MKFEIDDLTIGYGALPIVFDATLSFAAGEVTAVIGPNGAGKSTLVKGMVGAAKLFGGSVIVDGETVSVVTPRTLLQKGVAYVPQLNNVFPSLSVRENLELGSYVRGGRPIDDVLDILPDLKLLLKRAGGRLSGGQRNMLAVGRALMSNPVMLLVDEGTAGLAPRIAESLWQDFARLAREGVGVIAVEQNVEIALEHSSQVILLTGGRVRSSGPVSNYADEKLLSAMFLGSDVVSTSTTRESEA